MHYQSTISENAFVAVRIRNDLHVFLPDFFKM